jgi:hypothetical protein
VSADLDAINREIHWLMPLHKRTLLVVRAPAGKP